MQRSREQAGQVGRLVEALDRREHQFDRPLGGHAFGLQRIGQAEATDHQVRRGGAAAIELPVDILAFAEHGAGRQPGQFLRKMAAMQERRADFDQRHAQLAMQEAGDRDFQLRIREEEQALAFKLRTQSGQRLPGTAAGRRQCRIDGLRVQLEGAGGGLEPGVAAFVAQRERRGDTRGAAILQRSRGIGEERLGGSRSERLGGRNCTCVRPIAANSLRNWSSTTSARLPTTSSDSSAVSGRPGTSAARQASSPWVNVVSMPDPE